MPISVNRRLRRVDHLIAKIDRRLGFLESRVWFKPNGGDQWIEVEIFGFEDAGITPENTATGEQLSSHRFSIRVSRNWLEQHKNEDGVWGIERQLTTSPLSNMPEWNFVEAETENETYQDNDTWTTITLRVTQTISIPEITIDDY
jgi:hypothetical protein